MTIKLSKEKKSIKKTYTYQPTIYLSMNAREKSANDEIYIYIEKIERENYIIVCVIERERAKE